MERWLSEDYRALGLQENASLGEVKQAYRRLVRRYHPDVNPGDSAAEEQFIYITDAYQRLLAALAPEFSPEGGGAAGARGVRVIVNPYLTPEEQRLKEGAYGQLQELLRVQRYPRAIALVDGLEQRLPYDPEVRQWRAIAYQRWGRHLVRQGEFDKARRALKKALRIDPHNKSLWQEVNRDFRLMEHRRWQGHPKAIT